MYFKRLEMQGFKSFADPMVIDFHEGVTCIVGPNGSGKSNVSDALRWVLGEQSPKALRGGRMEEVIFNGTEKRRGKGMAEVTLVIDNSENILKIDYNEVAITRRMYRNGDSEYLINNNQCRLKDIRELIMDTGIGVDGYSIIGQGKIADIVSNKPEARRSIFEESAGIVAYKTRKTEAEHKLERTSQNLDRINDIVSEIEGRIDGLREDSEKAQKYLKMRDRFKALEVNITLRSIDNAEKRRDQYKEDEKEIQDRIDEALAGKKAFDEESSKLAAERRDVDGKSEERHARLLEIIEEMNEEERLAQHNEERLETIAQEEGRLRNEIDGFARKKEIGSAELAGLTSEYEEAKEKSEKAEAVLKERTEEYDKVQHDTSGFNKIVDEGNNRLFELHNEAANKKSEKQSVESLKERLLSRQKELAGEKKELGDSLKGSDKRLKEAGEILAAAENEKASLDKEYETLRGDINSLNRDIAKKRLESEGFKVELGRLTASRRTIEEMEHNYEGYNYPVKFVMQQSMKGIIGVVAEMIDVPAKLETAIETALGASKQNIICEDDASAKQAISELKKNRAGRLTFLPVSSVEGRYIEPDDVIKNDGSFLGIASDLVDYDDKFGDIIDNLLGRTAIVETLDDAIRLSRKAARSGLKFVTVEGEVISPSGAITGGKYKGENANLIARRNQMARLDKVIEETEKKLSDSENRLSEDEKALAASETRFSEVEKARYEADVRLSDVKRDTGSLGTDVDSINERIGNAEKEEKEIEEELKRNEKMISDLSEEVISAEKEIETVSADIEKAMSGYESKQRESEDAGRALTEARIESSKWGSKLSSVTEILDRIKREQSEYDDEIKTREDGLKALADEKESISGNKDGAGARKSELEKEKKEITKTLEELTKKKEEITEKTDSLSGELRSREDSINELRDEKYQLDIKSARNDEKLETLKDKLWDDFEISYAEAQDLRWEDFAMGKAQKESKEVREGLRDLGDVNIGAIEEYEKVSKRYKFLTDQREDVTTAMDELKGIIRDMDQTIKKRFRENFDQVEENFEKVFEELFGGGHAELRMEEGEDMLEAGIDIIAQPPGKKLQNIDLLSGGEKTMTAIALMFAVLKVKPTPFCILDEVEAALDDSNIDRFSSYLRNFVNTQFAIITHQKATMEHADVLYGITMPEHGVSRLLSLRLGDYDPDDYTE